MIAYRDVCMYDYVHINIYVYISVKDDCNAYCCPVMSAAVSGARSTLLHPIQGLSPLMNYVVHTLLLMCF